MKKYFWMLAMLLPVVASAQNETLISEQDSIPSLIERIIAEREGCYKIRKIRSNINLEFYTSANAYFTENNFDDLSFKINRVRLEIQGRLNEYLSYHFRQSFNKYSNPHSVDNLSSSIEYANITWHASDRFNLVAGNSTIMWLYIRPV